MTEKNKYNNLYQASVINNIAKKREGATIGPMNFYKVF